MPRCRTVHTAELQVVAAASEGNFVVIKTEVARRAARLKKRSKNGGQCKNKWQMALCTSLWDALGDIVRCAQAPANVHCYCTATKKGVKVLQSTSTDAVVVKVVLKAAMHRMDRECPEISHVPSSKPDAPLLWMKQGPQGTFSAALSA